MIWIILFWHNIAKLSTNQHPTLFGIQNFDSSTSYPLVNKLVDPEKDKFLVVLLIFQPPSARVYGNLLEGRIIMASKNVPIGTVAISAVTRLWMGQRNPAPPKGW